MDASGLDPRVYLTGTDAGGDGRFFWFQHLGRRAAFAAPHGGRFMAAAKGECFRPFDRELDRTSGCLIFHLLMAAELIYNLRQRQHNLGARQKSF